MRTLPESRTTSWNFVTHFICIVFLVDVPGFMVGPQAEEEGTLREGMRLVYTAGQIKVPTITLIIRKCYGMAGMATSNKNDVDLKLVAKR